MTDRGDRKGSGGGDERPAKRAKVDPVSLRAAIAEGVETSVPLNTIVASGAQLSDAWFIQHLLPFITWGRTDDLFDVNKAMQARSKSLKPPVKRLYDTAKFYMANPLTRMYVDAYDRCCFSGDGGAAADAKVDVFAATCTALAAGVETKTTRLVMRNIDTLFRNKTIGPSLARFMRLFKGLRDLELHFGDVEDEREVNRALGGVSTQPWDGILQCHAQLERLVLDGGCRTLLGAFYGASWNTGRQLVDIMSKVQWPHLHTLHCPDTHVHMSDLQDVKAWPTYLPASLVSIDTCLYFPDRHALATLIPAVTNIVKQCRQLHTLRLRFISHVRTGPERSHDLGDIRSAMDKALGVVADALGPQLVDLGWTLGSIRYEEPSVGIHTGTDALVRFTNLQRLASSFPAPTGGGAKEIKAHNAAIARIVQHMPQLVEWKYLTRVDDDRAFTSCPWPRHMQRLHFYRNGIVNRDAAGADWLRMLEASGKQWRQLTAFPHTSADMLLRMAHCTPQLRSAALNPTDLDVRTLCPVIRQLTELRQLTIVHEQCTHELLEVVAQSLPQLRDLQVRRNWNAKQGEAPVAAVPLVTDASLLQLAKSCRHLVSVLLEVHDAFDSRPTRGGLCRFLKQAAFLRRFVFHANTGLRWPDGILVDLDQGRPLWISLECGNRMLSCGSDSSRPIGNHMDDYWD